jgi:ankyrin repeat protein
VNAKANDGTTPLHLACQRGNEQAVELLLASNEIDEAITDENGDTPLHEACSSGETNIVNKILTKLKAGESVNLLLPNDKQLMPLHIACREGYVEIVKLLLKEGFHQKKDLVEAKDNERSTPLHLACENGREGNDDIVKTLLLNNADIFAEMEGGLTPMHIAAKYGHVKVMDMLNSSGMKIFEVQDDDDQTPLHFAAENNQVDMIEYLINQ